MNFDMVAQFHFLRPWWLMMILPTVLFVRFFFGHREIRSRWRGVIAPHLLDHLIVSETQKNGLKPTHMLMAGSVLASLVMAGPTWERSVSPFTEDQAPLVIVLDLSKSMDQTDIQPSRLDRAKQKIRDLLQVRGGSKTGIIVYAGTSHLAIPLTNDPQVIENLLFALKTDMMPRRGKAMEKALHLIRKIFQESDVPGTVLVIADGVSSEARQAFAQFFASSDYQAIVWGIGTRQKKTHGNPDADVLGGAHIPLAEEALKGLARDCSGLYVGVSPDKSDILKIRRQIDFHFTSIDDENRPWIDFGYWLLFPIAVVFVLWFRKGWTLTWGIACIVIAVCAGPRPATAGGFLMDLWLTPDQQGRYYFEKGDYKQAADSFENMPWKGVAFYMNENFEAAIEIFSQIKTPEGYFNLGNAFAQARHYGRALDAYLHTLAMDPGHQGAKKNIAILKSLIDELNRQSVAQKAEEGESVEQLGDDEIFGPGVEETAPAQQNIEQYSAEQILTNPELNEVWMRQVQQDPARFLGMKFQMQLNRQSQ
jgi:Ca-activated chloride channel homolog